MYWGCSKFHCRGCLNNFKGEDALFFFSITDSIIYCLPIIDIDFSDAVMDGIVCDNVYESEILKVKLC